MTPTAHGHIAKRILTAYKCWTAAVYSSLRLRGKGGLPRRGLGGGVMSSASGPCQPPWRTAGRRTPTPRLSYAVTHVGRPRATARAVPAPCRGPALPGRASRCAACRMKAYAPRRRPPGCLTLSYSPHGDGAGRGMWLPRSGYITTAYTLDLAEQTPTRTVRRPAPSLAPPYTQSPSGPCRPYVRHPPGARWAHQSSN